MSIDRPRDIEEWKAQRRAKKKQDDWIIFAVVCAVSLVLAGSILLVLLSGGTSCCTTTAEPNVQFWVAAAGPGANEYTVTVAGVSRAVDYDNYKAFLLRDGVVYDEMPTLSETSTDNITFIDLDGGGKLSTGDYFVVDTTPGGSYKLGVIWKDSGNERGSEEWWT